MYPSFNSKKNVYYHIFDLHTPDYNFTQQGRVHF